MFGALKYKCHCVMELNGESKWWKGSTENISLSGVLFRGEEFAEPNTPLEISLALPDGILDCGLPRSFAGASW